MKFNLEPLTRSVGRAVLKSKKNSPHIFFVGGAVGIVASTVLACRATLKFSNDLDEIQKDINEFKDIKVEMEEGRANSYSIERYRKDITRVYVKTGVRVAKLYGPPVILGTLSIAALTGSHIQLTKRNAALMAAYAAVQKAYLDYRDRVREEFGEERELEFYRATKNELVQNEDGTKEVKKLTNSVGLSPYARCFDEYSREWKKDKDYNEMFIMCQQTHANDELKARGHVFLNEVYDSLGFDRTPAGSVVGWVWPSDGDNFIDFGIHEAINRNAEYMNGQSPSFWLDFNVDGVIYKLI